MTTTTLPNPWTTPSVDVRTTAAVLSIALDSAYDGVTRGDIPSIRVGRAIRVPTAWLYERLHLPLPARD
jgi:hypothetical protein